MGQCCSNSTEVDLNATGGVDPQSGTDYDNEVDIAATAIGAYRRTASKVELSIAAKNLIKMDKRSKSDPFLVVKLKPRGSDFWEEHARTEIISNSQNPSWITKISLDYYFEEIQHIGFEVYDCDFDFTSSDATTLPLNKQDEQGFLHCTLGQIMGSRGQVLAAPLHLPDGKTPPDPCPTITIRAEESVNSNAIVRLRMRAENLDSMDLFGKSDPFLRFSCINEDNTWSPCFKSEVIKNQPNPVWNEINVSIQQIANGDQLRPVMIECFDHDKDGTHQLIGKHETSVSKLVDDAKTARDILLKRNDKTCGKLLVMEAQLVPRASFLDYIAGGTEVSFITAIDYTASNGDPMEPVSLHYVDPSGQKLNQYAQAIIVVGGLLEFYDTDKKFPVFGFGGKYAPGQPVSHCFAINGNDEHPDEHKYPGVQGILSTYYSGLQTIKLHGPTMFSEVLKKAAALAQRSIDERFNKYFVLMILTDGTMHDMKETKEQLVKASALPLSIIIVGIGDGDFGQLHELDSDKGRLSDDTGRQAERDIVQFVPMREFSNKGNDAHMLLTKQLLAEIPKQFLTYMESKKIPPEPKVTMETVELSEINVGMTGGARAYSYSNLK